MEGGVGQGQVAPNKVAVDDVSEDAQSESLFHYDYHTTNRSASL